MPVTHLPAAVFAAPCGIPQSRIDEVRDLITYPSRREEPAPFILREGKLFAFQDLRKEDGPVAAAVDPTGTARSCGPPTCGRTLARNLRARGKMGQR